MALHDLNTPTSQARATSAKRAQSMASRLDDIPALRQADKDRIQRSLDRIPLLDGPADTAKAAS